MTDQDYQKTNLPKITDNGSNKKSLYIIIAAVVLILIGLDVGAIFLLKAENAEMAGQLRDVFIIFMALGLLLVGIALVILIIQLAVLTNVIQNEVRPILNSTTNTVNTLKGTVQFLSDNLTEPVIKLNETIAMSKRFFDVLRPRK